MTKKFISIILALVFIISSFSILSVTASAANVQFTYNRTLALNYAERNWNNGVGLCADFASKCIQAGGINVYKPRCVDLYRELNGTYGTSYKLTLTRGNKGSIKMSDNVGKLEKGDLIFYFCNACRSFEHVVVCNGANIWGYAQDYAHNKAHNGKKQTYTYYHCGQDNWTMYSIHFDEGEKLYGERTNVAAPEINSIKNGANGIVVKWNAISGADSYRVYRKTAKTGWKRVAQGSKTQYTDKKATNGEKYYYTVRAIDNNVLSQYYAGKSIVALNAPTLSIANNTNSIRVSWSKIDNADGYYVYRAENNKWVRIATIKNNKTFKYEDKNIKAGVTYKYTVKAYDGKLAGAYLSNGVSIMRLNMPYSFSAQRTNDGVLINFSAVTYAQQYRVYRRGVNETKWTSLGFTDTNSYLDTTAIQGEAYVYTARAINGKSYSYYYKEPVTIH